MAAPLTLELGTFPVDRIAFGPRTRLDGRVLSVDGDELRRLVLPDPCIGAIELAITHPGEATRITHALDLIEPRVKVSGGPGVFPGILGPARTVGMGRTHRLEGMSVVPVARMPQAYTGVLQVIESVIDMTGPGADLCLGSETANLVVLLSPNPAASNAEFEAAMRRACLRIAVRLATTTIELTPAVTESLALRRHPGLPRVLYIDQVQNQGLLVHTLLYGAPVGDLVPTFLHPNEMVDGALVSGNYKGFMKIPTALHCANPVVRTLWERDGRDLEFAGVILTRGHHDDHRSKERSAQYAASLARSLGADGVVLSLEGTGNSTIDYMLTVEACEEAGIPAVPMIHEFGGLDGTDTPLVDCARGAVSMVSTGSIEKTLALPAMSRVIGGETMTVSTGETVDAAEARSVMLYDCFGAFWKMLTSGVRCVPF